MLQHGAAMYTRFSRIILILNIDDNQGRYHVYLGFSGNNIYMSILDREGIDLIYGKRQSKCKCWYVFSNCLDCSLIYWWCKCINSVCWLVVMRCHIVNVFEDFQNYVIICSYDIRVVLGHGLFYATIRVLNWCHEIIALA